MQYIVGEWFDFYFVFDSEANLCKIVLKNEVTGLEVLNHSPSFTKLKLLYNISDDTNIFLPGITISGVIVPYGILDLTLDWRLIFTDSNSLHYDDRDIFYKLCRNYGYDSKVVAVLGVCPFLQITEDADFEIDFESVTWTNRDNLTDVYTKIRFIKTGDNADLTGLIIPFYMATQLIDLMRRRDYSRMMEICGALLNKDILVASFCNDYELFDCSNADISL